MSNADDEDAQIRTAALQTAHSVFIARQRAEEELLQTREALRESQERLRAALTAAGTCTFRWVFSTNAIDWDGDVECLFGPRAAAPRNSLTDFLSAVHPDDRLEVSAQCERAAQYGSDIDTAFRAVWPDGSIRHVSARGKVGSVGPVWCQRRFCPAV